MAHLSPAQLADLDDILNQRALDLDREIDAETKNGSAEPYALLAGTAPDEGDESVADVIIDTHHAMIGQQLAELREISAAQGRIRNGSYGVCIDCQQEMEYDRLLAYPTATRCVDCQTRRERMYKHQPHPTL